MAIGETYRVKNIDYNHRAAKTFIDMGITPGSYLTIVNTDPLHYLYVLKIYSYNLAVRRNDLASLQLQKVGE